MYAFSAHIGVVVWGVNAGIYGSPMGRVCGCDIPPRFAEQSVSDVSQSVSSDGCLAEGDGWGIHLPIRLSHKWAG